MGDNTAIEWTDATWNPIRGCTRVSEGCRHCYAESVAARFSGSGQPYEGLAHRITRPDGSTEARWTGKVAFVESAMDQPLRWTKPRRIFVSSMSDLFHEAVPDEVIDQIFRVMSMARHHTFQVLTKRPERMRRYLTGDTVEGRISYQGRAIWPLQNVWLGVSVEDQRAADERIPILLDTPAAVRWISAEPLLGPVDLTFLPQPNGGLGPWWLDALSKHRAGWFVSDTEPMDEPGDFDGISRLDWVVVGGESGPSARPLHPDWARSLRDQCTAAGVPFFMKQWGEWLPFQQSDHPSVYAHARTAYSFDDGVVAVRAGKSRAGRLLDGVLHDAYPEAR